MSFLWSCQQSFRLLSESGFATVESAMIVESIVAPPLFTDFLIASVNQIGAFDEPKITERAAA